MQAALNDLAAKMAAGQQPADILGGLNLGPNISVPSMAQTTNDKNTGTVNTGVDRSQLAFGTPSINLGLSGGISADIATALGGNRATETPNAASTANLTDSQLTAAIMADEAAKTGTTVSPSATSVLAGLSNNTATQPTTGVLSSLPGGGGTVSTGGGGTAVTGGGGTGGTGGGGTGGTGLGTTGTMSISNVPTMTNLYSDSGGGSDNSGTDSGGLGTTTAVTPTTTTTLTPSQLIAALYGRQFLGLPDNYENYGSRGEHKFYTNYQKVAKGGLIGPLSNVRKM